MRDLLLSSTNMAAMTSREILLFALLTSKLCINLLYRVFNHVIGGHGDQTETKENIIVRLIRVLFLEDEFGKPT